VNRTINRGDFFTLISQSISSKQNRILVRAGLLADKSPKNGIAIAIPFLAHNLIGESESVSPTFLFLNMCTQIFLINDGKNVHTHNIGGVK
jgi:hypothetical protein